jgi:hypothetical protein
VPKVTKPAEPAWKEATPEVIDAQFQRSLEQMAYEIMNHPDAGFRAAAARQWPSIVTKLREKWQAAAEQAIAAAQADLARTEGRLM